MENKLLKFFKYFKKNFTFKNLIYNLISLYNEIEIKSFEQIKKYGEENIFLTQVTINISLLNNNENNKIDISIPYIKNFQQYYQQLKYFLNLFLFLISL